MLEVLGFHIPDLFRMLVTVECWKGKYANLPDSINTII